MFIGEYSHTIDEKGRLIIPVKYRDELGCSSCVVTKGFEGCLYVYPLTQWQELEEKLAALPLLNKSARSFARYMLSGASVIEIDKQGRALVPANLREFAKLEKDVELLGHGKYFEIWPKASFEEEMEDIDVEQLAEFMESNGINL